jgi:hypothetical protein
MSESKFMIKCVLCKADFEQVYNRSRFCEDCRGRKNRSAREKYYEERKQIRKGFII